MNHYAKLAVVAVRLFAAILFPIGLLGIAYFFLAGFLSARSIAELSDSGISCVVYTLGGLIVFALSKPIGRLLARGIGT